MALWLPDINRIKMNICVAQIKSVAGDVEANITKHKQYIDMAVVNNADIIVFPELSLTGYEPTLAKKLATGTEDSRFKDFQKISDQQHIRVAVGMPLKNNNGVSISMLIFQPQQPLLVYGKQHLHPDEEPFFVSGEGGPALVLEDKKIAFAICYEVSMPGHAANAFHAGANVYIASVAKTRKGVAHALKNLSDIAGMYTMTALMSNCVGICDGVECAGRSSVWNNQGLLIDQLDEAKEGLLIYDMNLRSTKRINP